MDPAEIPPVPKELWPTIRVQLEFEQGDQCAICSRSQGECARGFTLDISETGAVRGLICRRCTSMVRMAGDDPGLLLAAVRYLERGPRRYGDIAGD